MSFTPYYRKPPKGKPQPRFKAGRDPAFLAWLRNQPCCISGVRSGEWITVPFPDGSTAKVPARIEAAHVKTRGSGGVDRGNAVPLELSQHRALHRIGIKTWQRERKVDLHELAKKYAADYERTHD